jgi:hypothetical protein
MEILHTHTIYPRRDNEEDNDRNNVSREDNSNQDITNDLNSQILAAISRQGTINKKRQKYSHPDNNPLGMRAKYR